MQQNGSVGANRTRVPPPARPISSSLVAKHDQLELSRDRLEARFEHLSQLIRTFRKFDLSQDRQILKEFLQKVSGAVTQSNQRMLKMLDEQFDIR